MTPFALLALCLTAKTFANPAETLKSLQPSLGFEVFVPDYTAFGYELKEVEVKTMKGRKALRLKFINEKVANSFDLVESKSAPNLTPDQDLKMVVDSNVFQLSVAEDDTLVSTRKGQTDLMLIGSLMTSPSAKKMLERSQAIKS